VDLNDHHLNVIETRKIVVPYDLWVEIKMTASATTRRFASHSHIEGPCKTCAH
jgi:hypothetical protein